MAPSEAARKLRAAMMEAVRQACSIDERRTRIVAMVEVLGRVAAAGEAVGDDGKRVAEIFKAFLAGAHLGLTFEDASGLWSTQGASWLEIYLTEVRERALRRADQMISGPGTPMRDRVRSLVAELRRFSIRWCRADRHRELADVPAEYLGTPAAMLFMAFAAYRDQHAYAELRGGSPKSAAFPMGESTVREVLSD